MLRLGENIKTFRTYVSNCHSDCRNVQQHSHGSYLCQCRRQTGSEQHHSPDDYCGHAGRQFDASFQENFLAVQQHHVDAAELLPSYHGTGYDYRLYVTSVGEKFAETGLLFLRLVNGFL